MSKNVLIIDYSNNQYTMFYIMPQLCSTKLKVSKQTSEPGTLNCKAANSQTADNKCFYTMIGETLTP